MSPFAPAAAPWGGALDAESDDRSDGAVEAERVFVSKRALKSSLPVSSMVQRKNDTSKNDSFLYGTST